MRSPARSLSTLFLSMLGVAGLSAMASVSPPQAPATTPPATTQPATPPPATGPATPTPAPKPRAARPRQASPSTLAVKITDSFGAPLADIRITASGPVSRSGVSDTNGDVRFASMRPGTYRLRFESEKVVTLEREVTTTSQPTNIEVSLSAAPPPPPPPPAPKPEPAPTPTGANVTPPEPRTVSIPEFAERNLIGSREPSKRTLVACGGNSATDLVQIREPLKDQLHAGADALVYVVGGEGLLVLGSQEVPLRAGTFSVVPRGMTYTLQRRGRGGLILLVTLTDTPCGKDK